MATLYTNNPSRFGTCYATHDPTASQAPEPAVISGVVPSGGFPARDVFPHPRTPHEIRKEREKWGILPKTQDIIEGVAQRQAEDLHLDAQQRLEELERELELAGIEWDGKYLTMLNAERERLINAEILERAKLLRNNEDAATLLLLIGSL
mgnify:FL=1